MARRSASLRSCIHGTGVCEHICLRYKNFYPSCFDPFQEFGMSTRGLTLIFGPVPSTYFRPPNSIMLLFVDDSKISNADPIELQNDLIRIYNWAKAKKWEFNNTKTELLWFTLHRYKISDRRVLVFDSKDVEFFTVPINDSGVNFTSDSKC